MTHGTVENRQKDTFTNLSCRSGLSRAKNNNIEKLSYEKTILRSTIINDKTVYKFDYYYVKIIH